jgi:hypothetical protein
MLNITRYNQVSEEVRADLEKLAETFRNKYQGDYDAEVAVVSTITYWGMRMCVMGTFIGTAPAEVVETYERLVGVFFSERAIKEIVDEFKKSGLLRTMRPIGDA